MPRSNSSRSLKVKPEYIETLKNAVTRNGFPSQTALATELGIARSTLSNFLNGKAVDRGYAEEICFRLDVDLKKVTYFDIRTNDNNHKPKPTQTDWGEAAEISDNFECLPEPKKALDTLEKWIIEEKARIVLIEGMEGMGKEILSQILGKRIQKHFNYVIWRSMDQYQSLNDLLDDWLSFFSEEQDTQTLYNIDQKLGKLKKHLKNHRCLLILSNIDFALQDDLTFSKSVKDYNKLLKWVAEHQDKSCLVMTSDVEAKATTLLNVNNQWTKYLTINPLSIESIKMIFNQIGVFSATERDWQKLKETYTGNWWILQNVAINIQELFGGNISSFISNGEFVVNGIKDFIAKQLENLSNIEQDVMYWLIIYRHPINLFELRDIVSDVFGDQLLTIIKHLKRRFFLERKEEGVFVIPPMIRDYITKDLIEIITKEIMSGNLNLLTRFPLLLTTTKSEVREDQRKFLLKPIIKNLKNNHYTDKKIITKLKELLQQRQGSEASGFASGNLVNLLGRLEPNFNNCNFSGLVLRHSNFRHHTLQNTDFSNSDLSNSIFLKGFSNVLSVAFSPDGQWLAIGDANDQIYIWKVTENRPILRQIIISHNHWVRTLAFSPDSKIIASSGEDGNIYLRYVETGKSITTFSGHIERVRKIVFSPDGKILASSSDDKTVMLWNVERQELMTILKYHQFKVQSVVFHPKKCLLISASQDNRICLWDLTSYELIKTFALPENGKHLLRAIAISPDSKILATGTDDGVVRFWDLETGQFSQSLGEIHHSWLRDIQFSTQGDKIASASEDGTICLIDVKTGERLHTLRGNEGRVWSIAFHPKRSLLVSGHDKLKVILWHTESGKKENSFKGYSQEIRPITYHPNDAILAVGNNQGKVTLKNSSTREVINEIETHNGSIWSLAYNPDGTILVGGSDDTKLYVWDMLTGKQLKCLSGHNNWIRTVAISPDNKYIATGSDDTTIKIWDAFTYQCLKTITGHTDWIRSVCFHPTQPLLFSGSDDGIIKVWDLSHINDKKNRKKPLQPYNILNGYQRQIWTIAIHPNGNLLASGSNDNTICLWDLSQLEQTKESLFTIQQHRGWISTVAFSPDGKYLASGSYDHTIRLWDCTSGEYKCHSILQGHGNAVISLAFHPHEPILASSSKDGTIKRWNLETGEEIKPDWRSLRPYENMNITGVTGLTLAQKECLKSLGAVER